MKTWLYHDECGVKYMIYIVLKLKCVIYKGRQ